MFSPDTLIIHCSATADSGTVSWSAIRRWHMGQHPQSPYRGLPWSDIGYHFGIEYLGGEVEVLLGLLPDRPGAHCRGHNDTTLGLCVVGDYDLYPPSAMIWQRAIELARWICGRWEIAFSQVRGHREFTKAKSCPGLKFDMERFRYELKGGKAWPPS